MKTYLNPKPYPTRQQIGSGNSYGLLPYLSHIYITQWRTYSSFLLSCYFQVPMNCVTAPKANWRCSPAISFYSGSTKFYNRSSIRYFYAGNRKSNRIRCDLKEPGSSSSSNSNSQPETSTGIQLYRDIERYIDLITQLIARILFCRGT